MQRLLVLLVTAVSAIVLAGLGRGVEAQNASSSVTIKAEILGRPLGVTPEAATLGTADVDAVAVEDATIRVQSPTSAGSAVITAVTTDVTGKAETAPIAASTDWRNPVRVDIEVSAPGYASFFYKSLPLFPGGSPILTPTLSDSVQTDDLRNDPSVGTGGAAASGAVPLTISSCTGYTSTNTPPNVIKVYSDNPDHGADYQVHTVDFMKYVQHVLPREWLASWDSDGRESLRAGAVAVKMYGWYHVLHSASTGSGCYDVDSTTSYQVWDPNLEDTRTNAAVLDTWDYYLMYNSDGTPFETQYRSGSVDDTCGELNGGTPPGNIMSQWGSYDCAATDGYPWYTILSMYYFNPTESFVNGPSEVGSTAENLPALVPNIAPYNNTQVKISWTGQSGVTYYRCAGEFLDTFSSCSTIGTGSNNTVITITTTDQWYKYYRIKACQNGYCSATRGGAVEYRTVSGNNFYTTASYYWPYNNAYVATRNLSWVTETDKLYDGAAGYGGVLKKTCSTGAGANCGPYSWQPSSASYWFITGCQTDTNNNTACSPLRIVAKTDHVGGE